MFKKTITSVDYNGFERTEDVYFNLSRAEAMELELSVDGGFDMYLRRIIANNDIPALAKVFKEMICRSYGVKSDDGRYFNKLDENGNPLANKFMQSEAYSVLYMGLLLDPEHAGTEFMNKVLPDFKEVKTLADNNSTTG